MTTQKIIKKEEEEIKNEKNEIWLNFCNELKAKLNINEYKVEKKDLTVCITKIDADSTMYPNAIKDILKIIKKYKKLYYIDFKYKKIVIC